LSVLSAVAHARRLAGTRKPRKCAQRVGVRRLDAAIGLRTERCPEPRRGGPEVPRRRQAAALQGAFGTSIFRAERDSSPCGLPARTLRKAGPKPSGLRPPEGSSPPPVALAKGGPQAGDGSSSANKNGELLGMTCKLSSHTDSKGRDWNAEEATVHQHTKSPELPAFASRNTGLVFAFFGRDPSPGPLCHAPDGAGLRLVKAPATGHPLPLGKGRRSSTGHLSLVTILKRHADHDGIVHPCDERGE